MSARLPAPLRPGDTIAVTAPSSGVPPVLQPRLDVAIARWSLLEVAERSAYDACRMLHGLRLAGWFDRCAGVLVGRTPAPDGDTPDPARGGP